MGIEAEESANWRVAAVHQTFATLSIFFIGMLLLAIYRAKIRRHAVIIAFLVLSWLSAGVAMICLIIHFGASFMKWSSSLYNVPSGAARRFCNAEAIMKTLFWTAIPGFALAFILEVLRVLIKVGMMTKQEKEVSDAPVAKVLSNLEAGEVHGGLEGVTKSSMSQVSQCRTRISETSTVGSTCIFLTPVITSAAMTIFSVSELAQSNWTEVHANNFSCTSPNHNVQQTVALCSFFQLVLASALAMGAIMVYLIQHHKAFDKDIPSRFGNHLIVKMLFMSALTGVGAAVQWYSSIRVDGADIIGNDQSASAIYMISFPLFNSGLFVEREIWAEWRAWIPIFKSWQGSSQTG